MRRTVGHQEATYLRAYNLPEPTLPIKVLLELPSLQALHAALPRTAYNRSQAFQLVMLGQHIVLHHALAALWAKSEPEWAFLGQMIF